MTALVSTYRRLDQLQRRLWLKVLVTVLVLGAWGGGFGSLIFTSYSIDAQRSMLEELLTDQNLDAGDEYAVSLSQSGTVTVRGKTYGGQRFKDRFQLFEKDQNGRDAGYIVSPRLQAWRLVASDRPAWEPRWLVDQPGTTWLLAVAGLSLLLLIIWSHVLLAYLLTAAGTAAAAGLCYAAGAPRLTMAVSVMGNLIFAFILLTQVALIALRSPDQVSAVAHTVVKEASRTWIALTGIVLLLIILPLLPLWLDAESPLRFQVQTFIARAFGLTFAIAACMTLFLSCSTVAFEIRDRQIWQLMSKPLNRFHYLLGKWLGVMTVNLVLLVIAGLSTFFYIQQLRMQPVAGGLEGQLDALELRDQVLTARISAFPDFPLLSSDDLTNRVDQVIANDPDMSRLEVISRTVRRRIAKDLIQQFQSEQRSVPPIVPEGTPTMLYRFKEFDPSRPYNTSSYTFSGLGRARDLNSTITLRYRFYILSNDEHQTFDAAFVFNDDQTTWTPARFVPTMSHVVSLPPDLIREDGTLEVTIVNLTQSPPGDEVRGEINFDPDGLEIIFKAGSFEANYLRAVLMSWLKLAFLAALAICLSTFLSFPVACLLAFTVFIAGSIGPFLADSLQVYYPPLTSQMDWSNVGLVIQWAFQTVIRSIAQLLVFMLKGFGEYRPTQMLIEGRLIPWTQLGIGFLKLGVLWSGLSMLIGFLVIRSRQLAIYSGHG